jgi:glycyl-tRNA synthetase beta chain
LAQSGSQDAAVNESLLMDPSEHALWNSIQKVQPAVNTAREKHDYGAALLALASMRGAIDRFFEAVMVMAEDASIRSNRISLLNCVSNLFKSIADISRIVIERSA